MSSYEELPVAICSTKEDTGSDAGSVLLGAVAYLDSFLYWVITKIEGIDFVQGWRTWERGRRGRSNFVIRLKLLL